MDDLVLEAVKRAKHLLDTLIYYGNYDRLITEIEAIEAIEAIERIEQIEPPNQSGGDGDCA